MIRKNEFKPLFYQIKEDILQKIEAGIFQPGDQLPSENEIIDQYSVSSITAKRALAELVSDGLAYSIKGKGTFLGLKPIHEISGQSFSEQMLAKGIKPTSKTIISAIIKPDKLIQENLGVKEGVDVFYLKRIRFADGIPTGIDNSYIPYSLCERINEANFDDQSLYLYLTNQYDLIPYWVEQEFFSSTIGEENAKYLKVTANAPGIFQKRKTFTKDFTLFEYAFCIYVQNHVYKIGRYRIKSL